MPRIRDIIAAIEEVAPLSQQESWDNSGLLVGSPDAECTGVMLALDVTPRVINQARQEGCNLVVAHHPLIFKGVKVVNDTTLQGEALIIAIKADIAVYCAHTSLDNAAAPYGVSCMMAEMLGAEILSTITPSGTGIIARLPQSVSDKELALKVKETFSAEGIRTTKTLGARIDTVALCSGAGGSLIPDAIAAEADAIVTSDVRYHDFLDYGNQIFIVDLTHFDSEKCTKAIFKQIISQKFPNFAHVFCASEDNPIIFL